MSHHQANVEALKASLRPPPVAGWSLTYAKVGFCYRGRSETCCSSTIGLLCVGGDVGLMTRSLGFSDYQPITGGR
jgi:hypothetical protein